MRGISREILSVRVRYALLWLVSCSVGLAYGWLLVAGLDARYVRIETPPTPIRVSFIESALPPPPEEPVIEPPPLLPQLPIETEDILADDMNEVRPEPPRPDALDLENTGSNQELANEVEPNVNAAVSEIEEDHYAELRGRTYTEQPGGDVLVLAILVDRHGHVWNAAIMVPSSNPLGDLSRMLSLPGVTLDPIPQIPPGEKRWIDLRFRYPSQTIALP